MSSPSPIPVSATTSGTYWPVSGSIPIANDSDYYQLSDDTAGTTMAWLIQAKSNPGVDPVDMATYPQIKSGGYIYIPSLNTIHRVSIVRSTVEGFGVDGLTATIVFDQGQAPIGMVANTPTDIRVIDTSFNTLQLENIGGAPITVNGNNFVSRQIIRLNEPSVYDASGSELSIAKDW